MEGENANQGPSATHSSIEKTDDPADSVASISEDFDRMAISQAQKTQDKEIIREQIALAVGSESAALLELRHIVDKGYGLFAATDIKRGTCIFKEAPLVLITHGASESAETVFYVSQQVSKLCQNQRRAYRMLHKAIDSMNPAISRIMQDTFAGVSSRMDINNAIQSKIDDFATFKTNAFQVRLDKGIGTAVFLAHSRLNHSCSPNGHQSYNEREGLEMLHATRDIIAGEEITVTYPECAKRYVELEKLDEAFAFVEQVLQLHRICYGNNYVPNSGAGVWISKLKYLFEEKQKAAALAQERLLYQERSKAEKAAHQEGKKAWAADKKVNKKAKRAIKAAAEKAGLTKEDAEALLAGIDTGKLAIVAEKLKGEDDIEKVKSIIVELRS
ncbi:hypothetical protein KC332_g516 [Hortaea werneckii]|nr:hypothetical protein KC329_g13104 [Hortaea werneckii]KAI7264112.1 hypothetical protein KC335_g9450 [Hortaea werneckii]KAI7421069.1 hypothetical protein KC332_g516 [Hortaea werneckii]KAI7439842.1 hypothetical protein KC368_g11216 [Hortaea werneckii]KAI7440957.1 hypothetical protein KC336_g2336 [Hortaea werneckii]